MGRSIRFRLVLFIALLFLSFIASHLAIRTLLTRDFRDYLEADVEDRAYWVISRLETTYERNHRFDVNAVDDVVLTALLMGFELQLADAGGKVVSDTKSSIDRALPLERRRIALAASRLAVADGDFIPYPLFLGGREIGELSLRFVGEQQRSLFTQRTDYFFVAGGLIALVGTILFSLWLRRAIDRPVHNLVTAAGRLEAGDLAVRAGTGRDDEFGRLGAAFDAMADAIARRERARSGSLARFAHELRTPLAAMQAELEGMVDGIIPASPERFASLSEELDRLKKLVAGLESLYRVQKPAAFAHPEPVALSGIVGQAVARFEQPCREKGVGLIVTGDDITIAAPRDAVMQIVVNLLSNAVNATDHGSITVTTGIDVGRPFLRVADTGRGIPQDEQASVFDEFYGTTPGGLGLGLAIVKELATAIGATVELASAPGAGSTFTLRFGDTSKE